MKFFITPNSQSKHGYDFIIDDNGARTIIELTRKTTDGYIHLPAEYHDALNRKLLKFTDFEGKGEFEITRREGRTISQSAPTTSKKSASNYEDYLEGADKEAFLALIAKAKRKMETEKLKAQIAALEAQLAEAQA